MIGRIDHLVLTVRDLAATLRFYVDGLGMTCEQAAGGRTALTFGQQKINLHLAEAAPILPRAAQPTPGSGDLCLIADCPLAAVSALLVERGLTVEQGPVPRHGALGPMLSLYLRDPDGNLVEIAEYRAP